jgi:broad-specificity NMP kinase
MKSDSELLNALENNPKDSKAANAVSQKIALYLRHQPPLLMEAELIKKDFELMLKHEGFSKKFISNLIKEGALNLPVYDLIEDHQLEVYGYGSKSKVWLGHKGQLEVIPPGSIAAHLSVLVGRHKDDLDPLEAEIVAMAEAKGPIPPKTPIGQGIYSLENYWVVVSGMKAIAIEKDSLKKKFLRAPIFEQRKLNMQEDSWVNLEKINPKDTTTSLKGVFEELEKILDSWVWENKEQLPYITAIVMLSIFQQAMHWRPIIYLSGAQGTGKTLFAEFLNKLFSGLCDSIDKTTSFAIQQNFGHDSKIGFLDEFEHYASTTQQIAILNLLKTSCRGGKTISGRIFEEKPKTYRLHHMFFLASISFPKYVKKDQAIKDRMIIFDLKKKKDKSLILPNKKSMEKLGESIIETLIKHWAEIESTVNELTKTQEILQKEMKKSNCTNRDIDNFIWIHSILCLAEKSESLKNGIVPEWATSKTTNNVEEMLYQILTHKVKAKTEDGGGVFLHDFVYDAVESKGVNKAGQYASKAKAKEVLRENYCTISKENGKEFLAIQKKHAGFLLGKDEAYSQMDIETILRRDERIKLKKVHYDKDMKIHSLLIPLTLINQLLGVTNQV